ncbi:MAG: pirin family protein [Xanthomonadales bacterium]|nr:pirin family protein [Gammaproteobacteria bacterium]MBT8054048.1 pirin family protein [Gammaproteobacteria bacterium]NND57421.1 pirin family protein [Xanthomonadales bacterium]NNK50350.1 pirin family protein [Xanthomonadales bacterium]
MSKFEAIEPSCSRHPDSVVVLVRGRSKDLGGFSVRRVLPASMAPRVGPFVFFDEMGPADFPPGQGINVRPHPHIGLATVTFLLEGEILHRDSLGFVQPIQPGAVNLMTAGRGIVHSERTDPERERRGQRLHGLQVWMALPEGKQEIEPAFVHYPRSVLPVSESPGVITTVIIGEYEGLKSPVEVHARTLYLSQQLDAGAYTFIDADVDQLAIYVVSGKINVGQTGIEAGVMAVLKPGEAQLHAEEASQLMVIGGEDMGPRAIFWNFVHTSRARIEDAKRDWREMKFARVPGDDEFIPLPD